MQFVSFAQNFEDVILWRALGHLQNGFYVDVGAYSPDEHSVTRAFYDRGWAGINIEPNPKRFAELKHKRVRDINLELAASDQDGFAQLHVVDDTGLTTVEPSIAEMHKSSGWGTEVVEVARKRLSSILAEHVKPDQPIHFLKVDVEGHEAAALGGLDLSVHRPWVIIVEATVPLSRTETSTDWEPLILSAGYSVAYWDGLNRFYVADEHSDLKSAFSAPPNIFDGFITVGQMEAEHQIEEIQLRITDIQQKLQEESSKANEECLRADTAERRAQALEASFVNENHRANQSEAMFNDLSNKHQYILNRDLWETLLFRPSGKPKKAFRRLFFHNNGKPRGVFKKWILHPDGRPHRPFSMWLTSQEYQRLPRAVPLPNSNMATLPLVLHSEGTTTRNQPAPLRHHSWARVKAAAFSGEESAIVSFLMEVQTPAAAQFAEVTIQSLLSLNRPGWEIIVYGENSYLVTANSGQDKTGHDVRIVIVSERSNIITKANGQFIALLEPGDTLEKDSLDHLALELAKNPDADIIYSDEDVKLTDGSISTPYLKPSWSPELLYAFNYFGRLTLLSREIVVRAGGLTEDADLDAEWDLNLRASDLAKRIVRLPKIICHRHFTSHRGRPSPETQPALACRRTIETYWRAKGFDAVAKSFSDGTQSVAWPLKEEPLVSIIIPTKDRADLLTVSITGVLRQTDYRNLELIIVDTGSVEAATHELYAELDNDSRVRIINFKSKFNYSSACNFGAASAKGKFLLFLNNDIEVISSDWLSSMVRVAQRPGVGCVGVKLSYPSGMLQHGGVMIGPHLAALGYRGEERMGFDVFGSPHHSRNWLAVMGACQMISREAFSIVGGFDEAYQIAMSDVAICIRLWQYGYRTAYVPEGELIHHEGASRGHTNPPEDERRLAEDIRAAGIEEDPYLHPELDGNSPTPRLRSQSASGPADVLEQMLRLNSSYPGSGTLLELGSDQNVMEFVNRSRDEILWPPQPAHKVDSPIALARFTLDLLRRRSDIRERFPRALSDGSNGDFAKWLSTDAIAQFGLPIDTYIHIAPMYDACFGARARRYYFWREDIRRSFPHGLTPVGRDELFRWFLQEGRYDGKLSREEIWWLFMEASERPEFELVTAFAFTPDWQAMFPDGASPFGAGRFANWFSSRYRVTAPWVHPASWPFPGTPADQIRLSWRSREDWQTAHPHVLKDVNCAQLFLSWLQSGEVYVEKWVLNWLSSLDQLSVARELSGVGLNVIGHLRYPSGLRVSAEAIVESLQKCGVQTSLRDLRTDQKDEVGREKFSGFETFETTLIHAQPEPFFSNAFQRADLLPRTPRSYRIAYWYWEFDSIPDEWKTSANDVNEVWAATEFVATGLRKKLSVPVRTMFPGVRLLNFRKRDRSYFQLCENETIFVFAFHMVSIMERKNPLGLIRAFKLAFSTQEPVRLVLKTSFGDRHPAQMKELQAAAEGARITIIDQDFSHEDLLALINVSDAYVSLHRSEGLGLTMAEAMLLGKPVIATRYSGNLEFMDDENSLLVDYKLVDVGKSIPPYDPSYKWAYPSEEDASEKMRRIYEDKEFAHALGEKAKGHATTQLSLEKAGRKMLARLNEIRSEAR